MSAPPFLPCALEGLTPAQAITEISVLRRDHPRVPVVAVLPEGASRELAAVAAEHADAVLPDGRDFREVLAELGMPDPLSLLEERGITFARDARVEAWLLETVEPLIDKTDIEPSTLITCAVTAWNSTVGDARYGEEQLRLMANALAAPDEVHVPLRMMQDCAAHKRARVPRRHAHDCRPRRRGHRRTDQRDRRARPSPCDQIDVRPHRCVAGARVFHAVRGVSPRRRGAQRRRRRVAPAHHLVGGRATGPSPRSVHRRATQAVGRCVDQAKRRARTISDGVFSALSMPGIVVRDLATAAETLVAIATQARTGGALHLAYTIATNTRSL